MDTTFEGGPSTLAAGVRVVISRLVFILVLPLDFHVRIRVVRSMYLPPALHGIEASLLASDSLRKLRSSICSVVWSRRQPMASVGCLACWMGPLGVTLHFVWCGFGFVCFVGIWLFGLRRLVGFIVFWRWWVKVVLCMVLFIFFPLVLQRLENRWNLDALAWTRPGSPQLGNLAGPLQHFKASILDAWRNKVAADLVARRVFEVGLCWISMAPCNSLVLLMLEKKIRLCFVASWLGVSGMVSSWSGSWPGC